VLATVVHGAVVLMPALCAAVVTWMVAGWFARPSGLAGIGWWVGMLALGSASYVLFERLTTRVLPLAALLRLSLVFPDQTPSRYRVALLSGTTKNLKEVVDRAQRGDIGDTPAEAAETVLVLTAALNRHDRLTRGHSERVRAYAEVIGAEMGLDRAALDRLRWAALLHDVGKLAVPSEVLNKPGRLTDEEFEIIKTHPLEGERLVAPLADWLGEEGNAVGQHHERFDGGGYPRGLAGQEISLAARIVAVADTFDVITSARSYKRPVPAAAARAEIARCAGTQFDPAVTKALLSVSLGRLWRAGGPLTWLISMPGLANAPVVGGAAGSVGGVTSAVGVAAVVAMGTTSAAMVVHEVALPALGDEVAHVVEMPVPGASSSVFDEHAPGAGNSHATGPAATSGTETAGTDEVVTGAGEETDAEDAATIDPDGAASTEQDGAAESVDGSTDPTETAPATDGALPTPELPAQVDRETPQTADPGPARDIERNEPVRTPPVASAPQPVVTPVHSDLDERREADAERKDAEREADAKRKDAERREAAERKDAERREADAERREAAERKDAERREAAERKDAERRRDAERKNAERRRAVPVGDERD
jgi:hypothetical protein